MRIRLPLIALAVLGIALHAQADDAREPTLPQYKLTVLAYRVLEEAWQETVHSGGGGPSLMAEPGNQEMMPAISLIQKEANIGGHRVEFRGDTVLWDGETDVVDPNIIVLARPVLVAVAGQKANLAIGEAPPEYFEPAGAEHPDLYKHGKADTPVGITLGCTVSPDDTQGLVMVELKLETTILKERKKLEGVGLDVGPPILSKGSSDGKIRLPLGQWLFYTSQTVSDSGGVILLANVRELAPPSNSAEKGAAEARRGTDVLARPSAATVVIEIPPDQSAKALKALVIDPDATPLAGGPAQVFRDVRLPGKRDKSASSDDVVDWLTEECGASVKAAPRVILDPSARGQMAARGPVKPVAKREVFSPLEGEEPVPWTLMATTYDVPIRRLAKEGPPSESVEFDVRGLTVGVWAEPSDIPAQYQFDFGFHLRETVDPEMEAYPNAEMTDRQFRFHVNVERGQWIGFTSTMDKTGKRIIALCAVREEPASSTPAEQLAQGEAASPPPPQITMEARFVRIPAEHAATVDAALVIDGAAQPFLGGVTVFRDVHTETGERRSPNGMPRRTQQQVEEWLAQFDSEVLSAPRVTTIPRKPAIVADYTAVTADGWKEGMGTETTRDLLQALRRSSPIGEESTGGERSGSSTADIDDSSESAPPDDAFDWRGVMAAVRAIPSEKPGLIETDLVVDRRWDNAPQKKRLLGVFPRKHVPDIRRIQCGAHVSAPDKGWFGLAIPRNEDEDGLVVLVRMELEEQGES